MKMGTKSVLFGVHCFFIHPWFVALAWWKIYGFPFDPRLWVAFFCHDLGYFGKAEMDSAEGETHPVLGALIMHWLFDVLFARCVDKNGKYIPAGRKWYDFTLLHSRFYAKKLGKPFSRLCVADKLAIALEPRWFYLIRANLTGEITEYMKGAGARTPAGERSQWRWLSDVRDYCKAWAIEHQDCKPDSWTGTKRDLALTEVQQNKIGNET